MKTEEIITTLKNAWNLPSKKLIRQELSNLIEVLQSEGFTAGQQDMPMFNDNSNLGNEKREAMIAEYKRLMPNWNGGNYSQGFADAFNWLSEPYKSNILTTPTK